MLRRSLAISCCTTSLSVGLNGDFAVVVGSAFFSISRSISISMLVARSSAEADLLTSWAITGSRLVTCRRLPFSVTVTLLVECGGEQCRQVFRRPSARIAGLALLEARVLGRLAVVGRGFGFALRHLALWRVSCYISTFNNLSI